MQSIAQELSNIADRGLTIPDEASLLRLPDECFNVWLNSPEKEVVLSIRDERPGEEKILELYFFFKYSQLERYSDSLKNSTNDLGSKPVYERALGFPAG